MSTEHEQTAKTVAPIEEPGGELVTRVRLYNLIISMFFFGRRGKLDEDLIDKSRAGVGDRVLDIGAGPGFFALRLADRVGAAGYVLGVDPAPQMVGYATKKAAGQANVEFRKGFAQSLDLPDNDFDVVTATFAMHHLPEEDRVPSMAEMFRVLRPGGRLMLADLYPQHRTAYGRRLRRRVMEANDPRRYVDYLREIGFDPIDFTLFKPWTGCVVAVKPGSAGKP